MDWLLPFDRVDPGRVGRVGGKAASLARMHRRGLPVPPGLVIPTEVFRDFLEVSALRDPAERASRRGEGGELLRRGILAAPLQPGLAGALREACAGLGGRLIVRSSATDEDGAETSFAGQYETVANARPGDEVEAAVKRCWASWFGDRAMLYRKRQGPRRRRGPGMAVVVQRMIDARVSGVLFTVNPVNGSWREMVLEAVWGAGEALVSGQVAPDRYVLRRPRRLPSKKLQRVLARVRVDEEAADVVPQPRRLAPRPAGGLGWVDVVDPSARKLDERDARRLGRLGLRLEALVGSPQDVEWAVDADGRPWLVQSRSITAAGPTPRGEGVLWTRRFLGERWHGRATPLGWSVTSELLDWFIAYPRVSARYLGGAPPTRLHRGYPYFNVTVFRHLSFKLPGMPPPRFMLDFFPPDEEERWLRRFAAPPDLRVYGAIFATTFREQRWRRFRWNPWTNHTVWDAFCVELEASLARLGRGPDDLAGAWRDVERGIALLREYVKIHIISLLCANLFYQLAEPRLPAGLRGDLLRCPAENRTMQTNRALFALARGERTLEGILDEYGHRAVDSSWEIFSTRWSEAPEVVSALVEPYRSGDLPDPELLAREQARSAAAAREALRQRGGDDPLTKELLRLARRYLQLREDQRFEFDRIMAALKRDLLRVGGHLLGPDRAEQIQWLERSEVEAGVREKMERAALLERAAARARRWAAYAEAPPPPIFLRGDEAVEVVTGGRKLQGLGISPGRVTGAVRVLHSPAEADRLQPGEILVATATDPGWTPLFLVAGGAILELGSMLSHGAVIAREYRLPAVVNVSGATTALKDGQRVTLDGGRGEIWLEG